MVRVTLHDRQSPGTRPSVLKAGSSPSRGAGTIQLQAAGGHQVGAAAVGLAAGVAEHGEGVGLGALGRRRERHHAQALDHVAERRVAGQALAVAQEHRAAALALVGAADGRRLEFGGERGRGFGCRRRRPSVVGGVGFHGASVVLDVGAGQRGDCDAAPARAIGAQTPISL